VFTSARSPLDYCQGNESPALPLPVDKNGKVVYNLHLNVEKTIEYQFDLNEQPATSSDANSPMLLFDLNAFPPPESD